jgi:hypothetical protein
LRPQHTFSIKHRIADINYCTNLNIKIPTLYGNLYDLFRIPDDIEPDIHINIHKYFLQDNSIQGSNYDPSFVHPKLQKSSVQSNLPQMVFQELLEKSSDKVELSFDEDQTIVRNFSSLELDFYYNDNFVRNEYPISDLYSEYRVTTYFREFFSTFLPVFSAVQIHSSGVIIKNKSALFFAHSTGGKTTVVNNSVSNSVLSDDQIILRRKDGLIFAYATPFGRITSGPGSAQLGGIFLLEKSDSFNLEPIDRVEVVEYIWSSLPKYTYFLPGQYRTAAFQTIYDACHQGPVYRMTFPKDYIDWNAIEAAMNG